MVFHLDKCIGCYTCSIACKNIWTSRPGAEYMWWNNVETKPGTGYPALWEDQEKYGGGWIGGKRKPKLKLQGRAQALANIFFNPRLPTIDDYYEPWAYRYKDLTDAPQGVDQPVALPVSRITGKRMDIGAGPNWDDDLGGSGIYAAGDPNLAALTPEEKNRIFTLERMIMFYIPRICNHCINPGCVGACPAGAIYKRGEDGIVLVSQDKCRAWRMCISGCPYKKVYFNWSTGKSEKCILCYPRQETGQAPACFHACVGRIRYLGLLLYDADGIAHAASGPKRDLVSAQRELILDPYDAEVIKKAKWDRIDDKTIHAAQRSPVYKYVKEWKLALPLHPEFRTLPMLFYVPSLLPVAASAEKEKEKEKTLYDVSGDYFGNVMRAPLKYLASLFTAGDEGEIVKINSKLIAVRVYKRQESVGDIGAKKANGILEEAGLTPAMAEEIYRLTALANFEDRFVVPPFMRERAIEAMEDPQKRKEWTGTGYLKKLRRRF